MRRRRGPDDPRLLAFKDGRSWRSVLPDLVNAYVRETTGLEATAKDFRTWHATVLAAAALAESPEPGETRASRKRAVSGAMKEVSDFLGNTPTLARSSYVDPRVIEAYQEISPLADGWEDRVALHQLFPLLVHAAVVGGGYGARAADLAARYT